MKVSSQLSDKPVVVALDTPDMERALKLASALDHERCRVKVGKELFTAAGPKVVEALQRAHFEVFLDLKFHDIPNTVAGACRAARELGVWMLTVHASGGVEMMAAARETVGQDLMLVAVTVLTSMDETDLAAIGVTRSLGQHVDTLARNACDAGLDGVVCSAWEARALRASLGEKPVLVTPGIRPAGTHRGDQARVMTPVEAIAAGANYLVIGRAISGAASPQRMLRDINLSLIQSH